MATCANCGKEIRDDVWTCGFCGTPVSKTAGGAASDAPSGGALSGYGYAPGFEPQAAGASASTPAGASAAAPGDGLSRTTLMILIAAVVAIVAIIAVWFFFVRGGSSPFDGSWNASSSSMGAIVISGSGDSFKIKITGTDASGDTKSYTVPAHMDGSDLVITVDDFVKASGNTEQASQAKAVFETLIKNFRLVFTLQDPKHLKMTVEGTLANGQTPNPSQQSIVLTKN
jgi:hypothetical protein